MFEETTLTLESIPALPEPTPTPEEWRPVHVEEFGHRYHVSDRGRVKNIEFNKFLNGWPHAHSKKPKITLNWKGSHRDFFVKELVWGAFREPVRSYDIYEIDGDPSNVRLENLATKGMPQGIHTGGAMRKYIRTVAEFWDDFFQREAPACWAVILRGRQS